MTWARRSGDGGANRADVRPFRVVMRDVVASPFGHAVRQGVFDSVLLVTTSGRVVHQEGATDLRLTTLNRLVRKQSDGSWKELDFSTLPMTSQVLEVEMSGGRYFVYLQPCCAHLAANDGAGGDDSGLVVAGLIDAGTFRTASMAVSFSMMALMGAAIMAGIFSWPFVKLLFIGEGQRLRLIDVLLVGLCGLLWATLVTVAALDWYAYGTLKDEIDQQLQILSDRIRENMREELTLAYDQLESLDRWASEQTEGADRTPNLLSRVAAPDYPFLESFSLIDRNGMQVRKWATDGFATPRVSTLRREYFRHWASPHPAEPRYFLQSIRSMTTGNKEAVLSKPTTLHRDATVAAMTIPMISLTAAVLPPGFGFAVIDEEGQVLFHSDSSQRLDEQLFLETDRHRRLRAAVAARHAELMNVRYFGQDHRFYVTPLEQPARANWSLITFADKEPTRTVNIEWLVTAWLFALIYLSVYVLLCVVILIWRPSYRASWMWPDASRVPLHQRLIGSYALFVAAFGAAVYSFRNEHLLFVAWLLPFIVWTATYLALARRRDVARLRSVALGGAGLGAAALMFWLLRSDVVPATVIAVLVALAFGLLLIDSRMRLRHAYVTAGMLLLLLTGVLPTLAFFKVAHAIQVESFIKYEQLRMARQLQVRSVAAGREPWSQVPEIAQRASGVRQRLSVYDQFFFGTEPCEPAATASVSGGGEVASELPKPLEDLLPYYSETSVGMRELLHDRSSDDAWQWQRSDSRLVLRTPSTTAGQTLCLQSSVPPLFSLAIGGGSDSAGRIAKAVFLLCVVLLAVYWIVGFIARRIFLIDVVEPLWAQITTSIPMYPGSNLFIPWRASARKAQALPGGGWCLVDLARCPGGGTDADWFTAQRDRLEQCPPGETVVIDHVERAQGDPGFSARTLALVTFALDVQHRTVVLISGLRLESLLRSSGDIAASTADVPEGMWAATLRRFTVVDARFERTEGEPVPVIEGVPGIGTEYAFTGRVPRVSTPALSDVDCGDPVVNSVWAEVRRAATDRPTLMPLNIEQLYEEVGDRLDNHYQGLWASCSDAEKLVLEHLARERLLNEKDRRTVRVLMARGLIRKSAEL